MPRVEYVVEKCGLQRVQVHLNTIWILKGCMLKFPPGVFDRPQVHFNQSSHPIAIALTTVSIAARKIIYVTVLDDCFQICEPKSHHTLIVHGSQKDRDDTLR